MSKAHGLGEVMIADSYLSSFYKTKHRLMVFDDGTEMHIYASKDGKLGMDISYGNVVHLKDVRESSKFVYGLEIEKDDEHGMAKAAAIGIPQVLIMAISAGGLRVPIVEEMEEAYRGGKMFFTTEDARYGDMALPWDKLIAQSGPYSQN